MLASAIQSRSAVSGHAAAVCLESVQSVEPSCWWRRPTRTSGAIRLGLVENSRTDSLHTKESGGKKERSAVGAEAKEVWLTWVSSRQVYLKP